MHTDDARTPQPTYGIPDSSKSPCIVPSSPFLPCITGKQTSICIFSGPDSLKTVMPWSFLSGESKAFVHLPLFIHLSSGKRETSPSKRNHSPSLVIPSGQTSYLSRGMLLTTYEADTHETSCSLDTPPKRTRTFFIIYHPVKISENKLN